MANVYEIVTQRIIEQLEKGVIPWRKPWNGSLPVNYVSRKPYQGIILLLLPHGGEWLTFKQAKDSGGNVKKGEKSHIIVFFKMMNNKDEDGNNKSFPLLRYSNVFHISQCEGIKSKLEPIVSDNDIKPIETAQSVLDDYITRSGVGWEEISGSNKALYSPSADKITMPVIGQFSSSEEFYNTAFHEAAHSTGHKNRLDRDFLKNASFGSADYSKEELIAEISAAQIMNTIGVESSETFENSAAYIQGWLGRLKNDTKLIVSASSKAQKATDLILNTPVEL